MIRHKVLFLLFGFSCMLVHAQKPRIKVDINMEGRKESEVNEPGYTPWFVQREHSQSISESGVKFTLVATAPTSTATFRASWSKALVQSPYYSRLINDGVKIDNDILLANPGKGAAMELRISELPVGKHTIQTYHNIWQDTADTNFCPVNVYLNDSLVHAEIRRTVQEVSSTDATILFTDMEVEHENQEMVLLFESVEDFVSSTGKTKDLNVNINAFELNAIDALKQAREPVPSDGDQHVNADNGFFDLHWVPAVNGNIQTHTLYFGTDSLAVFHATRADSLHFKGEFSSEQTTYRADSLYSMNTYYWRVDETDSTGEVTEGHVWSFRPRHLAFRGAEGYGRFAIGGRGGKVVEVTNLNDDGPGSLREAITNSIGPRTIVFSVSGIIELNSRLVVKDPYITIAGQTAPGKGICIRKAPLGLGSESITRFIRVRLGAGKTYDGMGMAGCDHSIVDHCSVSWTIDEAFSSRNSRNITLQRTLIAEALNIAGHDNYGPGAAHGYAASIGGDIGSFHHNLLAHCYGRNWSLAGGLDGDGYYAGRLDIFNNVIYNWGTRTTDGGAHKVNFVNNFYKKGAASIHNYILTAQLEGLGKGSQSYYYTGNILQRADGSFSCDGTDNTCARRIEKAPAQVVNWQVFVDEPFFPSYASIQTAEKAYKSVLSDVGCTMPLQDDQDQRIIRETLSGTYTYTGSESYVGGIIDHQNDAGGYEEYPKFIRADDFDRDHDGLPDWWELLHGSNTNSAEGDFSDANADPDRDGYAALDDYLEWMSVPHHYLEAGKSDTIELSRFTAGYDLPVFSCESVPGISLQILDSRILVTPGNEAEGIYYLNILAEDAEGSSFRRKIGVCVGAFEPENIAVIEPVRIVSFKRGFGCKVYPTLFETGFHIEMSSDRRASVEALLVDLTGKPQVSHRFEVQPGQHQYRFECPSYLSKQVYILQIVEEGRGEVLQVTKVMKL